MPNNDNERERELMTFEDASDATLRMFENQDDEIPEEAQQETATEAPAEGNTEPEQPEQEPEMQQESVSDQEAQPTLEQQQQLTGQAVNMAEQATAAAQQQNAQLQQIMAENQRLQQQNAQLMEAIQQVSEANKANIVEEALAPPTMDLSRIAYEDEDVLRQQQEQYADQMAAYVLGKISQTMEPLMKQAEEGKRQSERARVLSELEAEPLLPGFKDMLPQIESILEKNQDMFSDNTPMDNKYITAYAIAKGVDSINHPKKDPTAEELMQMYENNPEFQELLEKKRVSEVKGKPSVPPLTSSSGGASAALTVEERPKTWEDASERTRRMFGMK